MHPKLRAFLQLPPLRQFVRLVVRTLLLSYLGLAVFAASCVNQMLFHPPAVRDAVPGQVKLHAADGNDITAVFLPNPQAAYAILFSYGNGDDVAQRYDYFQQLRAHGWAVCGYDYPGYGTSTGSPTESGCYAAINAAYDFLVNQKHIPPARIVLYGQSMGSGSAVDLASREPVGGLIVEGAFLSIFRVVTHYRILPWDKFDNIAKINSFHGPLLSIHARNDQVVPFWQGMALNDAYTGPKSNLWVPGAGHNNIVQVAPEMYWAALEKFRQALPLKSPIDSQ